MEEKEKKLDALIFLKNEILKKGKAAPDFGKSRQIVDK